jgi:hypothetical protein
MNEQQRRTADWVREVMSRRNLSARAWAETAGLGKDTVSRAIRDNYANVTSTRTIAILADAIGEKPPGVTAGVPSVAILQDILHVAIGACGGPAIGADYLAAMARALRETLLHLADHPEAASDQAQTRAIARAVARQPNG